MVAEQTNSKEVQNAVQLSCSCRAHFSMTGYVITLPQIAALKRHEVLKKLSTVDSAHDAAMLHNACGIVEYHGLCFGL